MILLLAATLSLWDVQQHKLPNGMEVWIKERRETQAVEVRVVVKTGQRYEKPRDSGLSHLVEHMLFKGTAKQSEAALKWAIERRGGSRNGITTPEATYYYVNIRDTHLDFAVDWLEDIVFHSQMREEHIHQARKDVYSEQGGHYPRIVERVFLTGLFQPPEVRAAEVAFPHAEVAERVIADLDHVDRAALRRFFDEYYVPNNMAVIVVGNVDPVHALEVVARKFGSIPSRPVVRAGYIPYAPPKLASEIRTRLFPPVGQMTDVRYGFWTRGKLDPDRAALRVLARHLDRRMKEEIRYRRALAYSVGAFFYEGLDAGVLYVYADVPRDAEDRAKNLMEGIVREVTSRPLTAQALRDAKEALVGSSVRYYESNSRLADLYQEFFLTGTGPRDEFAALEAVTEGDVLRVSRRRLQSEAMMFVVARPPLTYAGAAILAVVVLLLVIAILVWRSRRRK